MLRRLLLTLVRRLGSLVVLIVGITTVLFFLLRVTGDPAITLAGPEASEQQVAAVRAAYGFDRPLALQYTTYMASLVRLEFGASLTTGRPAIDEVSTHLGASLLLAMFAIVLTSAIAIPVGAWLGAVPRGHGRRVIALLVFLGQGIPGFVFGLLLIQIFAVQLLWFPPLGYGSPATWVLPSITLSLFIIPKLTRVVAANVTEAMTEDYVRTARANGASSSAVLWKHALPNALAGAAALMGTQLAYLLSGSVLVETIFAWPGLGWLLLSSTQTLDFPVIQATAVTIAFLIFFTNALLDLLFTRLDPRLSRGSA